MAFTGKFFNTTYYLTQNADVAAKWGSSALNHYITNGAAEGRSPNAWFDYQYYRANNADLATMTALQLFDHYENFGYKEARVTSETYVNFDEANYLATYSDLGKAGITTATALNHYLTYGISENRVAKNDNGSTISATTTSTTYRLTEGADNFGGSNGNDYFDASLATTVAGRLMTLNNSDSIIGGTGTDTLFVQNTIAVGGAALTVTPLSVSGIEILDLDNSAQLAAVAYTVDLQNGDNAITTIKSGNNSTGTVVVQNVQGVPATINLTNTNQNFTLTNTTAKMTGTADTATVNLMSVTGGTVSLGPATAGSGYETFNLVSGGSIANTLAGITDGAGTSLTTINLTGAQNFTGTLVDTTVTKFDASAFTGNLTFNNVAGSGAQNIIGGTGNDTINMVATYTSADTINGGAGTDTMVIQNAQAIAATTTQSNVSNIETISLSDTTNGTVITVNNFGATGLALGSAVNYTSNVLAAFAAGTGNFAFQDSTDNAAETVTLTVAGTATTDVLNVTYGTTTAAGAWGGGGLFTITGAETVNLTSQGAANTYGGAITLTDTAASQTLNILGNQNFIVTGAVRADAINASGMTGTAVLQLNGGTSTTATSITGTGNADVIIGSTAGDIINGGAGADFITNTITGAGATAADVLTGGAGFDTFTLIGDVTNGGALTNYSSVVNITDFTVGSSATTTDFLRFSAADTDYFSGTGDGLARGTVAEGLTAGNAMVVQSVAQNAAGIAGVANVSFIKLTTGVAFTTNVATTMALALGSASVNTLTTDAANVHYLVSYYDTTNSKMVIADVCTNTSTVAADTLIAADLTAAGIKLIGTIDMTAADYSIFGATNMAVAV